MKIRKWIRKTLGLLLLLSPIILLIVFFGIYEGWIEMLELLGMLLLLFDVIVTAGAVIKAWY